MKIYKLFAICTMTLFLTGLFFSCVTPSSLRESIDFEYYNLAEEYYNLKKWDKALEFYTKSKQSKSFYSKSLYKSALIFIEKKQYDEAELLFRELAESDPENANLLSYLAFAKAKQKNYLEAIDLYQKVLLLYPMNQTTKKNLALVYWYEGNKDEAKKIEAELLEENPLDLSLKDFLKDKPATDLEILEDQDLEEPATDLENIED